MDKNKVNNIIIDVINDYYKSQEIDNNASINTYLLGNKSLLDSMGLVNIIIDIESRFLEKDLEISLTSEKAMSQKNSPFKDVSTLSEYIYEQIGDIDE